MFWKKAKEEKKKEIDKKRYTKRLTAISSVPKTSLINLVVNMNFVAFATP